MPKEPRGLRRAHPVVAVDDRDDAWIGQKGLDHLGEARERKESGSFDPANREFILLSAVDEAEPWVHVSGPARCQQLLQKRYRDLKRLARVGKRGRSGGSGIHGEVDNLNTQIEAKDLRGSHRSVPGHARGPPSMGHPISSDGQGSGIARG